MSLQKLAPVMGDYAKEFVGETALVKKAGEAADEAHKYVSNAMLTGKTPVPAPEVNDDLGKIVDIYA